MVGPTTEATTTMESLAQALAAALGPEWRVKPPCGAWQAWLVRDADGATLHLEMTSPGSAGLRVAVAGTYPCYKGTSCYPGDWDKRPRRSCAVARGPAAIGRDFLTHFLPRYLELYAEALARQQRYAAAENVKTTQVRAVLEALGRPDLEPGAQTVLYAGDVRVTVDAIKADSLHLKLEGVTASQAVAIAAVLRPRAPQPGDES